MSQNEQFQRLVMVLRVAYWFTVAAIVGAIYYLPNKPLLSASVPSRDLFYYCLLFVAASEIVVMLVMDSMAYKASTGTGSVPASVNIPSPRVMPVLLFGFGVSTAIYGLLFRLIGGSINRSLSFLVFTFIAYIVFSIATVRYSVLLGRDQGSL